MMIVRLAKNWDFPDVLRQSIDNNGKWNDIFLTEEKVKECDLLLVFNAPPEDIYVKTRETWLFSQESPIENYRWHKKSFQYFDRVFTFWEDDRSTNIIHEQTCLPWHINKSYQELKSLSIGNKRSQDKISWITSNLDFKPGHKLRLNFKNFLEQTDFKFDLFGRGFNPVADKFEVLFPYQYSIAIENFSCNDYWTEKITDCFLSWTIPIYYGAKNINSYFPSTSIIHIDPTDPIKSLKIIKESIANNFWENNIQSLEKARNLILDEYQLFPAVNNRIKEHNILSKPKIKRYIPSNTKPLLLKNRNNEQKLIYKLLLYLKNLIKK